MFAFQWPFYYTRLTCDDPDSSPAFAEYIFKYNSETSGISKSKFS